MTISGPASPVAPGRYAVMEPGPVPPVLLGIKPALATKIVPATGPPALNALGSGTATAREAPKPMLVATPATRTAPATRPGRGARPAARWILPQPRTYLGLPSIV